MNFLYDIAWAQQAGGAQPAGGGLSSIILLVAFGLIFYFMIIRPQQKRVKEHKQMTESLSKGDEVVTSGGLLGKINKVNENFISISVSESVELMVQKHAISSVLPKGTIKSLQ